MHLSNASNIVSSIDLDSSVPNANERFGAIGCQPSALPASSVAKKMISELKGGPARIIRCLISNTGPNFLLNTSQLLRM